MGVQGGNTRVSGIIVILSSCGCGALTMCQRAIDALHILHIILTKSLEVGRNENTEAQKNE